MPKIMDTLLCDLLFNNRCKYLFLFTPDTQSDHEVPYADIVISVRGSSHPDLSDTNDHSSKLQRPVRKYK